MTKKQAKERYTSVEVLEKFNSFDVTTDVGGDTVCELRNFRRMADGSLERREGSVPLISLDADVRGVYFPERDDASMGYVVAGSKVGTIRRDAGESSWQYREIGTLETTQGRVHFIRTFGAVILMDGKGLWHLTPLAATPLAPYVPLYGDGWGGEDDVVYPVAEKPNVLTHRLRIRYCLKTAQESIFLGIRADQIECVYVGGELLSADTYAFGKEAKNSYVLLLRNKTFPADTDIDIFVVMPEEFCAAWAAPPVIERAVWIGDAEDERMLLFGRTGAGESATWLSRTTTRQRRDQLRRYEPHNSMLYLTEEDGFDVGDGIHAPMGGCRHYDRSLIFTEADTWGASGGTGLSSLIPVNTTWGCSSPEGLAVLGNTPITVCGRTVVRWTTDTDERNECNAVPISAPIAARLPELFGKQAVAFANQARREIWFYIPGSAERIWIWQDALSGWTSFDGFAPQGLFSVGNRVGYFSGTDVYVLDEQALCDRKADGTCAGIPTVYESGWLDLGGEQYVKRGLEASVCVQAGDQEIVLTLYDEKGMVRQIPVRCNGADICATRCRGKLGRFRLLRARVSADGEGPLRLWRLRLTARRS